MILISKLKKLSITAPLLVLAACSTTPEMTQSAVNPAKSKATTESNWQQAYGQPQETVPNSLGKNSHDAVPVTDVWQRVRNGFQMVSALPPQEAEVKKRLKWFVEHPDYVARVSKRAEPYLHYIVSEVDKRNMPMEIALLPIVESAFKPFAYSSSKAAGLWQFIPSTGKVYGLKQDWWYDGRRDVIASTDAALNYLQKLHNDFGDWELAVAAYNCGEGKVSRAIKSNREAGKATDFWSLSLPKETSGYVPKLLAISHLVSAPERYDVTLSPIKNTPYLETVNIGSQIDLALAAKLAGMETEEFYMLNPGFNHWATMPDGPHNLVVPVDKAAMFKQALADLPKEKRVQWQRHEIKQGESLGLIAKRYNTTVAVLKQANELASNTIRAGGHLLIPIASGEASVYALAGKQNTLRKDNKRIHTVKAGDTWWDLAKRYNVGVEELTTWNSKAPRDTLSIGQKLVVWSQAAEHYQKGKVKSVSYKIRSGDSLWKISQKFNVSVAQVREWNGMSIRTLLQPGQTLTLYVDVTHQQSS